MKTTKNKNNSFFNRKVELPFLTKKTLGYHIYSTVIIFFLSLFPPFTDEDALIYALILSPLFFVVYYFSGYIYFLFAGGLVRLFSKKYSHLLLFLVTSFLGFIVISTNLNGILGNLILSFEITATCQFFYFFKNKELLLKDRTFDRLN